MFNEDQCRRARQAASRVGVITREGASAPDTAAPALPRSFSCASADAPAEWPNVPRRCRCARASARQRGRRRRAPSKATTMRAWSAQEARASCVDWYNVATRWCARSDRTACPTAAGGPGTRAGSEVGQQEGARLAASAPSMAACSSRILLAQPLPARCYGGALEAAFRLKPRAARPRRRGAPRRRRAPARWRFDTYQPLRVRTSAKPRACSCIGASRTSVRLTPR